LLGDKTKQHKMNETCKMRWEEMLVTFLSGNLTTN
jgi:hypothetical protein